MNDRPFWPHHYQRLNHSFSPRIQLFKGLCLYLRIHHRFTIHEAASLNAGLFSDWKLHATTPQRPPQFNSSICRYSFARACLPAMTHLPSWYKPFINDLPFARVHHDPTRLSSTQYAPSFFRPPLAWAHYLPARHPLARRASPVDKHSSAWDYLQQRLHLPHHPSQDVCSSIYDKFVRRQQN